MRLLGLAVASALAAQAGAGLAASVTPDFQFFGDLPQATFGGTGIPTDPTAVRVVEGLDGDTLTLGLSATQRFENPSLGNNGAGTFFATPGVNDGTPGSTGGLLGATWNFNFFVEIDGESGNQIGDYGIELLYDFDPGLGTDEEELGVLDFGEGVPGELAEGSQNLLFSFLGVSGPIQVEVSPGVFVDFGGSITAPSFGAFDPNATGEYSFLLRSTAIGQSVAINVQAVPLPGAAMLLLTAFGGLMLFRRRRA